MKIEGLIVNELKEIAFFIVNYGYGRVVHSVPEMKKQVKTISTMLDIEGVEIKDGVLALTKTFPHYQIEGLKEVQSIMNIMETNPNLKKELCGIDEEEVELSLSYGSIRILKSFRNPDFFTDYDYESNGYNDAEFIGWDTIPTIVAPYLEGIVDKDSISCGGGEKLWFSVEVYCDKFAKLVKVK